MHVNAVKGGVKSVRDFFQQYVMFVVSILTALGLELVFQSLQHANAAAKAQKRIEAELRADLVEVRSTIQNNSDRAAPWRALNSEILAATQAGKSSAAIYDAVITPKAEQLLIGVGVPQLTHAAWDVAIADQSAGYIAPDRLSKYAAAYAALQDLSGQATQVIGVFMAGDELLDVIFDLKLGTLSPQTIRHVSHKEIAAITATQSYLKSAEKVLAELFPGEPPASAGNKPDSRSR